MPYCGLQTNARVDDKEALAKKLSALVAQELGKPEMYVMVSIQEKTMTFGGSTEKCAFVDLRSIGLTSSQTPKLSKSICDLLEKEIGVKADRTYISFADAKGYMWGWNGSTF
jgi:phenylpyruvate tautomerase